MNGVSIITYNKAIWECGTKRQAWTRAVSLVDELHCKSLEADVVTYNSTVGAIVKTLAAWQVAMLALQCAASCRVRQDVKACSSFISACGTTKRWRNALFVASQIHLTSLRIDSIAATSAINALERTSSWQQAIIHLLDSKHKQWQPSSFAGNAVIRAAKCEWGSVARCILTTLQARDIVGDLITYNSMIEAASEWPEASSILLEISDRYLRPDVVTLNSLLAVFSRLAQWQRALVMLDASHEHDGLQADTVSYNTAITTCGRCSKFAQALHVLDGMLQQNLQPDVITQSAAMQSCARATAWQMALSLSTMQMDMNAIALNAVLISCERSCEWQLAVRQLKATESEFAVLHDFLQLSLVH